MVSEPSCGAQERRTRTCPSRSTRSITKRGESPTGRGFGGDPSRPGRPGRHGEPGPTKVDQLAPGGCDRPLAAGDRGGGGRGQRSSLRTESEDRSRDRSDTDDGGAAGLRLSAPGCWMTPASNGPAGVHPDGHPLRRGTRTPRGAGPGRWLIPRPPDPDERSKAPRTPTPRGLCCVQAREQSPAESSRRAGRHTHRVRGRGPAHSPGARGRRSGDGTERPGTTASDLC